MSVRRHSRELALQCLYQIDQSGNTDADIAFMSSHFDVSKKASPYAQDLVSGVRSHWDEINSLIETHARNWRVSRMAVIDRNLLRIAVFELLYRPDVPASVVLDEAIEISRRFSTDDAASFVNGILDSICKNVRSGEPERG